MLSGINGVLSSVFTPLYGDATYTAIRSTGGGDFDEPSEAATDYPCKAQINDSMSNPRGDGDTQTATRFVMVLTASLPVVPRAQDTITITPVGEAAQTFRVSALTERDPANTYYLLEVDA
jgi:hypothetical protein